MTSIGDGLEQGGCGREDKDRRPPVFVLKNIFDPLLVPLGSLSVSRSFVATPPLLLDLLENSVGLGLPLVWSTIERMGFEGKNDGLSGSPCWPPWARKRVLGVGSPFEIQLRP